MIEVRGLEFTYPASERPAVREMSFEVRENEIFGFLGPSGAGKSTTQKILIGLLRGYRGAVRVLDRPLEEWKSDYYERIGVSFEFPNHFLKLTALENLTYFGRLYEGETDSPQHCLERVGLGTDGEMLVSQYSKGMKNRLSVARALLHRPALLFLDEPTAGLDPVNARRVKDLIREQQHQGRTVFLTTHDMTVADELCDRVGFIVDGSLAVVEPPDELKLRHGRATLRVEFQREDGPFRREFPLEGLGENEEFARLLRAHPVRTLHSQEATMEEVFIRVTGRELA